jgi:hypothetical protein
VRPLEFPLLNHQDVVALQEGGKQIVENTLPLVALLDHFFLSSVDQRGFHPFQLFLGAVATGKATEYPEALQDKGEGQDSASDQRNHQRPPALYNLQHLHCSFRRIGLLLYLFLRLPAAPKIAAVFMATGFCGPVHSEIGARTGEIP